MLLFSQKRIPEPSVLISVGEEEYLIHFRGFAFVPGLPAGLFSIRNFLEEFTASGDMKRSSGKLKGQYLLFVYQRKTGRSYCFTDESGNFHGFYGLNAVSDSFLELVKFLGLKKEDMDPGHVAEFLHWGNFHYNRTFFSQVKKIKGSEIILLDENGSFSILEKTWPSLENGNPEFSMDRFFQSLAASLRDEKVICDITGGVDSRMLVSALHHYGLNIGLAISGIEGNEDIRIARQVSKVLDKELLICFHDLSDLGQDLNNIFGLTEGLSNIVSYHRAYQLSNLRRRAGFTVAISGAGGEIYKDFSWMTDFPFYNRKRADLFSFYHLRFCPIAPAHNLLRGEYRKRSLLLEDSIISEWKGHFLKSTNSQTYDNLYFFYKWPAFAGRFITNISSVIPCYAPFLELDMGKYTFSLPRTDRLFNRLQRKWISRYAPDLSILATTEGGMSVSDRMDKQLLDIWFFISNRTRRLLNKAGQKLFRKSYLPIESPNHPDLLTRARALGQFKESVELLIQSGILSPELSVSSVPAKYVGPVLTLGKLLKEIS